MHKLLILNKQPHGNNMQTTLAETENQNPQFPLPKGPARSDAFNEPQRQVVAYFFMRLKAADSQQYDVLMPDTNTEQIIKAEYAHHLVNFTPLQIDRGFEQFHKHRQAGDEKYRFLNIDQVIGLISGCSTGVAAHKAFKPLQIESDAQKQQRKALGSKHCAELLKMLSE